MLSALSLSLPDVDFQKTSKGTAVSCDASRHQRAPLLAHNNALSAQGKMQDSTSLGSSLSVTHNSLTASVSAPTQNHEPASSSGLCYDSDSSPKAGRAKSLSPSQPRFAAPSPPRFNADTCLRTRGRSQSQEVPIVAEKVLKVHGTPPPYRRFNHSKPGAGEGSCESLSDSVGSGPSAATASGGEPVVRYITSASQPPPPSQCAQ